MMVPEWLVWLIALLLVPILIPHAVWITKSVLEMKQTLYGAQNDNGLLRDVRKMKEELPKAIEETRHKLRNETQVAVAAVEDRVHTLEQRRR